MKKLPAYTTLLSILVITSIAVSIAISLISISLDSSRNSQILLKYYQAKALANACAEQALSKIKIKKNSMNISKGTLILKTGSCDYEIKPLVEENWEIHAIGNVDQIKQKLLLKITKNNLNIILNSWQEVSDF